MAVIWRSDIVPATGGEAKERLRHAGLAFVGDSRHIHAMETVAQQIHLALQARFAPTVLTITDDSAKHAGHAGARPGGQSHFTVLIVSEAFAGVNRVARHRLVYAALGSLFEQGLHALAITAKTPAELTSL